jgi:hypothetical protein
MAYARFVDILRLLATNDVELEHAGRPKDLAALPILRATLDELTRRSS